MTTLLQTCQLCDESYMWATFSSWQPNVCYFCNLKFQARPNVDRKAECPVCLETDVLVRLPTCTHELCYPCCKRNYFGVTTQVRPLHWREIQTPSPKWPSELGDLKEEEHDAFWHQLTLELNWPTSQHAYEWWTTSAREVRNQSMATRPAWMNDRLVVDYENACIAHHAMISKVDADWKAFVQSKHRGSGCCPFCRANPRKYPTFRST